MPQTNRHLYPEGPLAEVVRHFYCIQTDADSEKVTQHLSPNLDMLLVFNFGEPMRFSLGDDVGGSQFVEKVGLIGPLRRMLHYQLLPGTDIIAVVFQADGFYRLFRVPVDQMSGDIVQDPDTLPGISGFAELWQLLADLNTVEERVALLMEYGNFYLSDSEPAARPLLRDAGTGGTNLMEPAKAIAVNTDLSARTIQMRFRKYMGFSGKEFSRFLRFKKVIESIQHAPGAVDWMHIVDSFGYHDQSHLIKDFRYFLGTTPRRFVQEFLGKEFCVTRE